MRDKGQPGAGLLIGALILGVLGDALLRVGPWSLNLFLWITALLGLLLGLTRWIGIRWEGGARWLLIPILLFAGASVWRDSPILRIGNILAILVLLALVMLRGRSGSLRALRPIETLVCLALAWLNTLFGFVLLIVGDIPWKSLPLGGSLRHLGAVARGLLIAIPLLLVFGGLFAAADASFEHLLARLLHFDLEAIFEHGLLIGLCTWIAGGFLRGALIREETRLFEVPRPAFLALGVVEISIILGLVNLLFLTFVCVQIPYFFGGQAHVVATANLTAADYARRGFFELVAVAAMVLPMLLGVQGMLRSEHPQAPRLFAAMAGALSLLTLVIMASALERMWLYHIGYGLTELRFYTTAFMGWLALVFVWFSLTNLRGRRDRFVFGALVSGTIVLGILNLLNPDAFIVRANMARLEHGRSFDADYATSLSADAVPALIAGWPRLPDAARHTVATQLHGRWIPGGKPMRQDWRVWNFGRARAEQAVWQHQAEMPGFVDPSVAVPTTQPGIPGPADSPAMETPAPGPHALP